MSRQVFISLLRLERGLGSSEARDRHAEGAAAHVIEANFVAEVHRERLAPLFAADGNLHTISARLLALLRCKLHQLAHALHVDRNEGILGKNLLLYIRAKEGGRIVARETKRGLREIVRAKAKELGIAFFRGSYLIRRERCPW